MRNKTLNLMQKKASIEFTNRQILMLIMFVVLAVMIILLMVLFTGPTKMFYQNLTDASQVFCKGDVCG